MDLYQDFKLATARNLTLGSRLNRLPNLVLWYEPTLSQSFISGEIGNGKDISRWNDISQNSYKNHAYAGQKTNANGISYNAAPTSNSTNTKGPIYITNGINNLPTLQFRNSPTSEYRYLVSDINSMNQGNEDLLLILVIKYNSGNGHVIDRQCSYQGIPEPTCANYGGDGTPIGAPLFGVQIKNSTNDLQIDCRYNDNTNCSGGHTFDSGYDITSKPAILTLQRTYGQSIKLFYDGKEVSSKSDVAKLLKIQPLKIGRHVNWETFGTTQSLDTYISEIIFITDKITDKDRDDIENYLGKKYAIGVSH